ERQVTVRIGGAAAVELDRVEPGIGTAWDGQRDLVRRRRGRRGRGGRRTVAGRAPRIGRGLARDRDEPPAIRAVGQRQLQHAVYLTDVHFAVRNAIGVRLVEPFPTRPDDDLADPLRRVRDAVRRLRGEALVVAG